MTDLKETYQIEQAKWDEIARSKIARLRPSRYRDFHALAHSEDTMTGISEFLGDLRGKRVLEIGCGLGEVSALLARSGAIVTAFDISYMSVYVAVQRAELMGVSDSIHFCAAAGEAFPFASDSFDVIVGKGVLHHLHAPSSQPELYRVLKPGGKAAFSEPLGTNPLLTFAREYVPYRNKHPRGADHPLKYRDIRSWTRDFSEVSVREVQLFAMLERVIARGVALPALRKLDRALLERAALLRPLCRYVVLLMQKAAA